MEKLRKLSDELSGLTTEELGILSALLLDHPENNSNVSLMVDGDPVPPNPTHPPKP